MATNFTVTSSDTPGASAAGSGMDGVAVNASDMSIELTVTVPPERFRTVNVPVSFTSSGPQHGAMVVMTLNTIRSLDGSPSPFSSWSAPPPLPAGTTFRTT